MKISGTLLLLSLLLAITNSCTCQDTAGYTNLINQFHEYVDNNVLPGTIIFLEKDGHLKKDIYGYQDIETETPLSENSVFRIASMTKPLIATAIMQLVEQGLISLDDPVVKYIPEVAQMFVYDGTKAGRAPQNVMTIRHLMSHTSGSTSGFDFSAAGKAAQKVFAQQRPANLKELVVQVCNTKLAFEPGEGWAYGYSNDLLAYLIEKVKGIPIDQYLKTNILQPLDMHHTSFQAVDANLLISIHAPDSTGHLKVIETGKGSKYTNGKNMVRGNGGLVSTAGDYLNFCRMILNKGTFQGKKILQPASVATMMKNNVPSQYFPMKVATNEMIGQGYGLGFGVAMADTPFGTEGDVYWPGSLYTYFFISPANNAIGIFMTQLYDLSKMGLIWEFHDLATKAW